MPSKGYREEMEHFAFVIRNGAPWMGPDNLQVRCDGRAALKDAVPRNMEAYDQGYGCIWYRTTLPAGPASLLQAAAIHDFGYVFLDGEKVGILDRRAPSAKLMLPVRRNDSRLDILVEPMGRINFGPEMADHKGLIAPVKLGGAVLKNWDIFRLPLDGSMLANLN